MTLPSVDTVIIGAGLAGLTAAAYLARAGQQVLICERQEHAGGRAVTEEDAGFRFNLGPRALFAHGPAVQVLHELEIPWTGTKPKLEGALADYRGKFHALPTTPGSLFTTSLLPFAARMELIRVMATLPKLDISPLHTESVRSWVDKVVWQPESRLLLLSLIRLATYCNQPEEQSAGAALGHMQQAMAHGDYYVDGGWGHLAEGLRSAASRHGARLVVDRLVTSVYPDGSGWIVRWGPEEDAAIRSQSVILAVSPQSAAQLVEGEAGKVLQHWARQALPAQVSCLDLGLAGLPKPERWFAIGLDHAVYFSNHSRWAELAPPGMQTVHLMQYLHPTDQPAAGAAYLEQWLERLQPGWRQHVEAKRVRPRMVVSHGIVRAATGGLAGRPGPAVPGVRGIAVAGDWVGPAGLLSDAVFASAKRAAELILERAE